MPEGQVLEFTHVTKRFNEVTAVSDFSARVEPGAVTAFLGPNGAGKTTTLRILLGQVRATSGTATIGGATYAELRQPLRTIGAVLEETVYRPRRTAERQLTIAAKANGIPLSRVGEVLSLVGLEGEGDSRIGGFSLGMRQRLSVAHALLGDPGALVFDEPANGLDPEGIRWMRLLMRRLADEGRTVLVSSHVLSEVEQVADNVLVLSKGSLVLASGIETLADPKGGSVIVDAADRGALTAALSSAGFDIEVLRSGLTVRGGDAGTVGAVAADAGIALSTLVQRGPTLEDVFIDLMRGGRLTSNPDAAPAALVAPAPSEASASADAGSADAGSEVAGSAVAGSEDAGSADAGSVEAASGETASADAGSAEAASEPAEPAESVVAIPVAAAAAWAAEAAAAPAGDAVADDLEAAAEVRPLDDDRAAETPSDENAAAEAPSPDASSPDASAEDASEDTAPAGDALDENALDENAPDENAPDETPAPSFDEILFGSSASASAGVGNSGENDHGGVEIFADLDETAVSADTSASASGEEDDPRAAAVSSMLAAAARAYYEDEPKDYPLSAEDQAADDDATEEGAHWSVASTGVIDTVPSADEQVSDDAPGTDDTGADDTGVDGADASGEDSTATDRAETHGTGTDRTDTESVDGDDTGAEETTTADGADAATSQDDSGDRDGERRDGEGDGEDEHHGAEHSDQHDDDAHDDSAHLDDQHDGDQHVEGERHDGAHEHDDHDRDGDHDRGEHHRG